MTKQRLETALDAIIYHLYDNTFNPLTAGAAYIRVLIFY